MSSPTALSRTVRVSTPSVAKPAASSARCGAQDTRPRDGLTPTSPQHEAGMRIEPPPSLACATGSSPAATAAAAPPLEPPRARVVSHGLRHAPFSSDSVCAIVPNSGVFVLPRMTKPASLMLRTVAESTVGTFCAYALHEYVVGIPATSFRSLIAIGTP